MKSKFFIVSILSFLVVAGAYQVFAAQSVTFTYRDWPSVNRMRFVVQSATDGTVSFAVASASGSIDGRIMGFTLEHDDTATPTNQYDVYLRDSSGLDLLAGNGVDMATSADQVIFNSTMGAGSSEPVTLKIENAGDTKKATVTVFWR
jgi:hypothetical protein